MKSILPFINLAAILVIIFLQVRNDDHDRIIPELRTERLSIVDEEGHLYISISNPARQALATANGSVIDTSQTERDVSGIIFFNRTGDEIGGIIYDGTDSSSIQGITFDQLNNDQVMAIMKDEYYENDELKRWYGMFFRERSDSVLRSEYVNEVLARIDTFQDEAAKQTYLNEANRFLNEEVDTYRMFLGREANEEVGLFLYDSKGRERIKLYVDETDNARLVVIDSLGVGRDLAVDGR